MGSPTKTISYRYDSRGNRSALIDHDGGRFTYSYDAVNRIKEVLNPQGDRTTYSYDNAGRRTLKKLSNGTRASFTYDAAGNLTKLYNLKSTGAVISSFDYTYDKVGNRMSVLEAGGSRVTWSYDNGYQLAGEHRTGANAYGDTYTYDPAGNRLLKNHDGARTTFAYDAANQLNYSQDGSGRTTFTFDADGNQQVIREPSGNRTTYAWDYENRMTSARLASGIRNTMAYDADGLRVKLDESTGTKKFVWDDQNNLGETDASNDTQVVYTNEPLRYGNLLSQRRGSTSHWYHFDALGSTRELTDASAVVTDTRLYDAWGNAVASTGSAVSPLRWVGTVGYYFDAQTGTYYVRARSYEPRIARWVSRDPIVVAHHFFLLDAASIYGYGRLSPIIFHDPSGLLCQDRCNVENFEITTYDIGFYDCQGGGIFVPFEISADFSEPCHCCWYRQTILQVLQRARVCARVGSNIRCEPWSNVAVLFGPKEDCKPFPAPQNGFAEYCYGNRLLPYSEPWDRYLDGNDNENRLAGCHYRGSDIPGVSSRMLSQQIPNWTGNPTDVQWSVVILVRLLLEIVDHCVDPPRVVMQREQFIDQSLSVWGGTPLIPCPISYL